MEPMLNMLDTDASSCCQRLFCRAKVEHLHFWTCPKCGQEYRVEVVGAVRHWMAHAWTAIFR